MLRSCFNLSNKFVNYFGQINRRCVDANKRSYSIEIIKKYEDLPGPKCLPVLGNLLSLSNFGGEFDILDYKNFQIKLQRKYGDLVKWNILGKKDCFVFDPKLIKEVYRADGVVPKRITVEPLTKLQKKLKLSTTLVNSMDEKWKKLRSAINPILARPQTILSYLPNHNIVANEFIDLIYERLENKNQVELDAFEEKLRLLALEYISEIAFNKRLRCLDERSLDATKFVNAVSNVAVYTGRLIFSFPFWKIYPTKDWKVFEEGATFIYAEARKYISEAQSDLEKSLKENQTIKKSILIQILERRERYGLTMDEVLGSIIDLILGGVDTTSISIHFILYELGTNPDIQQKLFNEINSILGGSKEINEENIEKFKYLKHIVKETFRVYNIATGNSRILQEDLNLNNYLIPKGTMLFLGTSYIMQSDRFYTEPARFDPSRWEKIESGEEFLDPYAFLPFGFGPRTCIGRRIAEQEIYVTIAKIIQNFQIEYTGEKPGMKLGLVTTPDKPLKLKITKRN